MKLALHRSITFWSGLLVMAFICWTWWDSMQNTSAYARRDWTVASHWGGIYAAGDGDRAGPRRNNYPAPACYHAFQRAFFIRGEAQAIPNEVLDPSTATSMYELARPRMQSEPASEWVIFIPYWVILLTVAAPWLPLLLWRARRRRKAEIL